MGPAPPGVVLSQWYAAPSGFALLREPALEPGEHGTQMAHIIAETAPGAELLCAAVLEDGDIVARILLGLDVMVDLAPDVLILPFGIDDTGAVFTPFITALLARDVVIVAACGNGGAGQILAPACLPGVLAVGALDTDGARGKIPAYSGSLSNPQSGQGLLPEVVAAPPSATLGTSAAAARLGAQLAKLRRDHPAYCAAEIIAALCQTARPPIDAQRHRVKWGHARPKAVAKALSERVITELNWQENHIEQPSNLSARLNEKLGLGAPEDDIKAILHFGSASDRDAALAELHCSAVHLFDAAPGAILSTKKDALRRFSDMWSADRVTFFSCDVAKDWL